jgi:hypothetical protein
MLVRTLPCPPDAHEAWLAWLACSKQYVLVQTVSLACRGGAMTPRSRWMRAILLTLVHAHAPTDAHKPACSTDARTTARRGRVLVGAAPEEQRARIILRECKDGRGLLSRLPCKACAHKRARAHRDFHKLCGNPAAAVPPTSAPRSSGVLKERDVCDGEPCGIVSETSAPLHESCASRPPSPRPEE